MVLDRERSPDTESPIGDVAYLTRSEHRVPMLLALTDRPRSRSDLCELAGVSSSTVRRTIDEFEDRAWIREVGYQYETTWLGEAIATGMDDLIGLVETEQKLRDVWYCLPDEFVEFPVETWSDVTVTVAEPESPYRPVNRFESILRETEEFRFLRPEVALMEPCFDVLVRLLERGVDVSLIDRPNCHTYFLSTYPERSEEMLKLDNFTVLEHDDLPPYGIGIFDDRVAISCYEQDSGTARVFFDTEVPAIREWAESVYDSYRSDARPVDGTYAVD